MRDKIKSLKDFAAIPFAKVTSAKDYKSRELYVYYYAPLIFKAIEKEMGEQSMWKWLSVILNSSKEHTNYAFLKGTLTTALQDKEKALMIESKYFENDKSLDNTIKEIEQK